MRTFIAAELEPAVRNPLLKFLLSLPADREVRWCTEQQLHITLKFLGEVQDTDVSKVCDAAATASRQVEPFSIRIHGLGCFPNPRSPRVLWCGVDDAAGGCRRWVELADPLFADLGFSPEERAFTPHLTLGRVRGPAGGRTFQKVLETATPPQTEEMQVKQVTVFESRLLPGGAQYKAAATICLGAQ